ncbi:MAG: hypothetical protein H6727_10500 [Myxococcales bacterium]|nr:hypothetical protein [Myxococcales bacterium]
MKALIRGLASRKTTILLISLLSVFFILAMGGAKTQQSLLKSFALQEPLLSLPMLILGGAFLLHLLLKPIAALLGRSKPKKQEADGEDELPFSFQEPAQEAQAKKSTQSSVSVAEVETFLPLENVRAFFRLFRIDIPEEAGPDDTWRVQTGPRRGPFLFLAVIGLFLLFASVVMQYGLYPSETMHLSTSKQGQKTVVSKEAPLKNWLSKKLSFLDTKPLPWGKEETVTYLMGYRSGRLLQFENFPGTLKQRFEQRWDALTQWKPLSLKTKGQTLSSQIIEARILFQEHRLQKSLLLGQTKRVGHLLWTLAKATQSATLRQGTKEIVLEKGKWFSLSEDTKLAYRGQYLEKDQPFAVFFLRKDKKLSTAMVPIRLTHPGLLKAHDWSKQPQELSFPTGERLELLRLDLGADLHYQPYLGLFLGWIGLFLFFVGFVGAWWLKRYKIELQWSRSKNVVRIEASGLYTEASRLAQGLKDALYFPADQMPPSNTRRGGSSPQGPGGLGGSPQRVAPAASSMAPRTKDASFSSPQASAMGASSLPEVPAPPPQAPSPQAPVQPAAQRPQAPSMQVASPSSQALAPQTKQAPLAPQTPASLAPKPTATAQASLAPQPTVKSQPPPAEAFNPADPPRGPYAKPSFDPSDPPLGPYAKKTQASSSFASSAPAQVSAASTPLFAPEPPKDPIAPPKSQQPQPATSPTSPKPEAALKLQPAATPMSRTAEFGLGDIQKATQQTQAPSFAPPAAPKQAPKAPPKRSGTDEFDSPFQPSPAKPSLAPTPKPAAPKTEEDLFGGATAVSKRPDLLAQLQAPAKKPTKNPELLMTRGNEGPADIVDAKKLVQKDAAKQPVAPQKSAVPPAASKPSPSSAFEAITPKTDDKGGLDMDALFGDLLKDSAEKTQVSGGLLDDDIDSLFDQISTPKKK